MRRLLLFFVIALLCACSQSDDGPIPVYPDGFSVDGYGYVLFAELDSGSRFHLYGDTVEIALDSMWTFGNCFLKQIEVVASHPEDSILSLKVNLALGNTGVSDCPQPLFRPDTVIRIPFLATWKDVREIRVEGDAHNDFFKESPDTSSAASSTFKDSILVRRGGFSRESVTVYLDSAFGNPHAYPRRTSNDTAGILAIVDSFKVKEYPYRFMESRCTEIHDSCETVPDTVWGRLRTADTSLVPVRLSCAEDSTSDDVVYCLSADWEDDSTAVGDSVYIWRDTTWSTSFYYAERIPKCSGVNSGDFSGAVTAGRYYTAKFMLFVPDAEESGCGPAALPEWIFYRLNPVTEILDSALADTLLAAWKKASVGLEEEEDD